MSLSTRFFAHGDEDPLADLKALPTPQLRKVALWWLKRAQRKPELGAPLAYRSSTGDLGDCRKIYFDEDDEPWNPLWEPVTRVVDDPRPRYRIVYRLWPDGNDPDFIEVISIGAKPQAYWDASARLERRS